VKRFPINRSGRRKIDRAIRAGWQPGMSLSGVLKKRSRRTRQEAGGRVD